VGAPSLRVSNCQSRLFLDDQIEILQRLCVPTQPRQGVGASDQRTRVSRDAFQYVVEISQRSTGLTPLEPGDAQIDLVLRIGRAMGACPPG